jgi:hypothetical protein
MPRNRIAGWAVYPSHPHREGESRMYIGFGSILALVLLIVLLVWIF